MPTQRPLFVLNAKQRQRAAQVWDLIRGTKAYRADFAEDQRLRGCRKGDAAARLTTLAARDAATVLDLRRRWGLRATMDLPDPKRPASAVPEAILRLLTLPYRIEWRNRPGWTDTEAVPFSQEFMITVRPWATRADQQAAVQTLQRILAATPAWRVKGKALATLSPGRRREESTAQRGLAVHKLYKHHDKPMSLQQVASRLNIPKSTAHRLNLQGLLACPVCTPRPK
jgi:hypothetical protein